MSVTVDRLLHTLTKRFSKQFITTTPSEVKPAPISEQVNNTHTLAFTSSDSESEAEQGIDDTSSIQPIQLSQKVTDKQPVLRTSSAEKRRYCESKRSTSSSSSCSSDDELKELSGVSLNGHRTHIRHKPPPKDRRITKFSTKDMAVDLQDDDEVFVVDRSNYSTHYTVKRTRCLHQPPLPGRYTDFDKMRRTTLTQVSKSRKSLWRSDLSSSYSGFARMGHVPIFPAPCSPLEVGHQSFHSIAQT